ncbi:hypothetical protein [Phreatobacter sp.]|uniref:hypothetical protein n=1 Tax=Phreatobacter sp. TaxID=1966341 RepID=UPI003F6E7F56
MGHGTNEAAGRRLLALTLLALLACGPALADTAPQDPQETQEPPAARSAPSSNAMTFRMVEGQGLFGLTRWVQASGAIFADTAERFEQFARSHPVSGLTVALDSPGGRVLAGVRLGRAFRAAGVNTTVARTMTGSQPGGAVSAMVAHGIACGSACTYAFIGGVQRTIATTARFTVHQFSRTFGRDGRLEAGALTQAQYENAQRLSAELAVHIQDMGVDARLLRLAASVPYGRPMRLLTGQQIGDLRIAMSTTVNEAARGATGWLESARPVAPQLFRRTIRSAEASRRVDEEITLVCHREASRVALHYRVILVQGLGETPARVEGLRARLADQVLDWQPRGRQPEIRANGASMWMTVAVPREALQAAARTGSFTVEFGGEGPLAGSSGFAEGLGQRLDGFLAACDGLRNAQSATR